MSGEGIQFRDERGVRWTVTRRPAGAAGRMRLEFESETGERRATEVVPLDDEAWAEIQEWVWRSLLTTAEPA